MMVVCVFVSGEVGVKVWLVLFVSLRDGSID